MTTIRVLALGVLVASTGCSVLKNKKADDVAPVGPAPAGGPPPAADLVKYLNTHAGYLTSIDCRDINLDVKAPGLPLGGEVSMGGKLVCHKPRDFFLTGEMGITGGREVLIGSNSDKFWFWVRRAEPANLYFCSHADFDRGINLPFPFQPEWVLEALGMQDLPPAGAYTIRETPAAYELVEETKMQGKPVTKITAFHKSKVAPPRSQVISRHGQGFAGPGGVLGDREGGDGVPQRGRGTEFVPAGGAGSTGRPRRRR